MFDGAMVDLARTPEEAKEDIAETVAPIGAKASVPKYPYGTCICLEDETLEKVGLAGDLPEVGEIIAFHGIARVTCASKNEREMGDGTTKECTRVELQITHMGIAAPSEDPVEKSEARRKRFYHEEPDGDESD